MGYGRLGLDNDFIFYPQLQETIPIHFNSAGEPDGYGSKQTIILFPIIGSLLYTGITILNRFPHFLNYPVEITPDNAERLYLLGSQMLRWLNWVVAIVFLFLEYLSLRVALGHAQGLGFWFLPVVLVLIFTPLLYYLLRLIR